MSEQPAVERVYIREDSIPVHSNGRFTVPKHVRRELEIGEDDVAQFVIVDGPERFHFGSELDTKSRARIPARIRNEHGIGDGDDINIEVSNV